MGNGKYTHAVKTHCTPPYEEEMECRGTVLYWIVDTPVVLQLVHVETLNNHNRYCM